MMSGYSPNIIIKDLKPTKRLLGFTILLRRLRESNPLRTPWQGDILTIWPNLQKILIGDNYKWIIRFLLFQKPAGLTPLKRQSLLGGEEDLPSLFPTSTPYRVGTSSVKFWGILKNLTSVFFSFVVRTGFEPVWEFGYCFSHTFMPASRPYLLNLNSSVYHSAT